MRNRYLRPLLGGLAFVALLLGVGGYVFLSPKTPPLRAERVGVMEPLDGRTGVYRMQDGSSRLLTPDLDTGFRLFQIDHWATSDHFARKGDAFERRGERLRFVDGGFEVTATEPRFAGERMVSQPYTIGDLFVERDVTLAGWVLRPAAPAQIGVVILHGSGDSDRMNSWYVYFAHTLASAGVTVILPDKRGSGRSGGDWRDASFQTLAEDGAAWLELLRGNARDIERFGFIGVSQGGSIAPLAARIARADFAHAQSASGTTMRAQLRAEVANDVAAAGAPAFLRPGLTAAYAARAERRYPAFWRQNGTFDMLTAWREWGGPFLIAYGRLDERDNVPVAASLRRLERDFAAGDIAWRAYDNVGHSLIGENDRFAEEYLADLVKWLMTSGRGA